jgi:hypothetical protein
MDVRTQEIFCQAGNVIDATVCLPYALGKRTLMGQDLASRIHQLFIFSPMVHGLLPLCSNQSLLEKSLSLGLSCIIVVGRWHTPTSIWARRAVQGLRLAALKGCYDNLSKLVKLQLFVWQKGEKNREAMEEGLVEDLKANFGNPLPLFRTSLLYIALVSENLIELWQADPLLTAGPRAASQLVQATIFFSTFLFPAKSANA